MKNKNGFTLIELVAVVVILVILMVIAINMTNKHMESSRINVFLKEANTFARGALSKESVDRDTSLAVDDVFHNSVYGKVCYSVSQSLAGKYVSKTSNEYKGSVEVCYGSDCTYQTKMWITDGKHYIDGLTSASEQSDISTSFSSEYPYSCGVKAIGGGTGGDLTVSDFEYTGSEQVFDVILDGVYALEAWGAQGGEKTAEVEGGYGAYAYAEVSLKRGSKLYINVGEKGTPICTANNDPECRNAYNGGYKGTTNIPGGGGASHIASKSGKIYEDLPKTSFYIVAGGGGGAPGTWPVDNSNMVKHAGAYCNYYRASASWYRCQTGTYAAYGPSSPTFYGGGGGFYGPQDLTDSQLGVGGLSYAHHVADHNASLYCYNCYVDTANVATHKSYLTQNFSEEPISQYAKLGNGHVRITYIENYTES